MQAVSVSHYSNTVKTDKNDKKLILLTGKVTISKGQYPVY